MPGRTPFPDEEDPLVGSVVTRAELLVCFVVVHGLQKHVFLFSPLGFEGNLSLRYWNDVFFFFPGDLWR